MEKTLGFYDYCVPYNKDEKIMHGMLQRLVELGYKTIAIEQVFDHSKKENIKRGADIFPEPHDVQHLQKAFCSKLKILQRLTIVYVDPSVSHAMSNSLILKKYHIIAGKPKTDAALSHCCTTFGGDLVTFDGQAGSKLLVNRKAYRIGLKRGIFYEIKYAPAIADSTNRKDMIKLAHNYSLNGQLSSIIFSSGATNIFELRGPYDVANLAFIFGLSEDQGKNAIYRTCRLLFLKAESRRLGKTMMFIRSKGPVILSDSSEDDKDDEDGEDEEDDEDDEDVEDDEDDEDDEHDEHVVMDIFAKKYRKVVDGKDIGDVENSNSEQEDNDDFECPSKKKKIN